MTIVTKKDRKGFSDTAAQAQDIARGQWVLVTQNDCMFKQGSIDVLIRTFIEVEKEIGREIGCIGIAGGVILRDRGYDFEDWSNWNGDGVVGYNQKISFRYVEVDYLNGFLLLYRGDVARRLGIRFDSQYFCSCDDADISYQFSHRNHLPTIMVSMDAYNIPLIHHMRNQTIPNVFPGYARDNKICREMFVKKWFGRTSPKPKKLQPHLRGKQEASKFDIAFLTPGFPLNGGVRRILKISNMLQERGHKVVLASERQGTPDWFDNKVPISYDWRNLEADRWVVYECCEPKVVREIAKKDGNHYLLVLSVRARKASWVKQNILNRDYIKICTTDWMRDYCNGLGQELDTRQTCLYTGLDLTRVHRIRVPRKDDITVGTYTNNIPSTHVDDALRAFQKAKEEYPWINLLEFDAHSGISPDRVKEIYSQCDIWLNAAEKEGIGMPPLEAMACGCALVTTDTLGNRFYAKNGQTALVSEPSDVKALADNLIFAIKNRRLRQRLAEGGLAMAKSLTWKAHIDRFERAVM
jgi:glycosyltransferase involved in cell wall biosynthesis